MKIKTISIICLLILISVVSIGIISANVFDGSIEKTSLEITSNNTLKNGDLFTVKLINSSGVGIANKTISVVLIDSNKNITKINLTTDSRGLANFTIDNNIGNYTVDVMFMGDGKYNSSKTTQNLTIEENIELESYDSTSTTSNYESSSSNNHDDYKGEIVYSTDPNSDKCVLDENGHIDQDLVDYYNQEAREKYGPIG